MSIYNSSRLAAHKREREEEKYSIGSSGTSATARVRDARRDAYLSEMGQTTSTPVGGSIGRSASTTPTAGSVGSSTSVGGYQAPKTTESKGSGYTPTYGPGALYTSAGSTASSGSDRTTYRNTTSGYTPTYGPGALYTSAGSTASGGSDRTTYRNRTSGYTPTYGNGALYSSTDNIAGKSSGRTVNTNGGLSDSAMHNNKMSEYDLWVRQNYQAARDKVSDLPYSNKLPEYDKQLRTEYYASHPVSEETKASVDTNTGIGNTDPYVPQIPFFPGVIQPYPKQPVGTPDFMLVSASESIRSSIDDLKAQEAEAKKQLDIAEKMYNLGLYAKQNFTEAELAQQKADYEAAQEALNQITAQIGEKSALYYQVVRQEEFQSLNQNPEAFTTYQNTRQLESDMERISNVIGYYQTGVGDANTILHSDIPYLAEKYGLDEPAFYEAAYGAGAVDGRNADGSYQNAYGLYVDLQKQVEESVEALGAQGYPYEYMTGYERWREKIRTSEKVDREQAEFAKEHPVIASIGAAIAPIYQPIDLAIMGLGNIGHNDPGDPETYIPFTAADMPVTSFIDTTKNTVANDVIQSDAGRVLYNIGMDTIGGVTNYGLSVLTGSPALAALINYSQSAADQAKDIIERGGNNRQVLTSAVAAGTIDMILDQIPLEHLLRAKTPGNIEEYVTNALQRGGINAGTNMVSTISHVLADAAVMGEDSYFQKQVDHYITAGLDENAAKRKAFLDQVNSVIMSGAQGFASGAVTSSAVDGFKLLQEALAMPEDTKAHQRAAELSEQLETKLTEQGLDVSDQYHRTRSDQQALIDQTAESILTDQAVGELAELVETEGSSLNFNTLIDAAAKTIAHNSSNDYGELPKQSTMMTADPMFEIMGAGLETNPVEIDAIVNELQRVGVQFVYRDGSMAYGPGLFPGEPGQLIIDKNASYAAWLHEYKHFCDDRDDGFLGMRVFEDTEKCIQREIDAYSIEIELARQANRLDIARALEELLKKEIQRYE